MALEILPSYTRYVVGEITEPPQRRGYTAFWGCQIIDQKNSVKQPKIVELRLRCSSRTDPAAFPELLGRISSRISSRAASLHSKGKALLALRAERFGNNQYLQLEIIYNLHKGKTRPTMVHKWFPYLLVTCYMYTYINRLQNREPRSLVNCVSKSTTNPWTKWHPQVKAKNTTT